MINGGFESILLFFGAHELLAYGALFGAMLIEGETFLVISGVLAHLGALNFWYVLAIAFIGVMIGDILWYSLGILLRHPRLPRFVTSMIGTVEAIVNRVFPHVRERPILSLILAKFIYGTNHATLIFSGLIGIPFLTFVRAELLASLIWVPTFATLGYFFGYAALYFTHRLSIFFLIILLLIVGFIALQRYLSFYYEHRPDKDKL